MRRRLDVSPGPLASYGPLIVTLAIPGSCGAFACPERLNGWTTSSVNADVLLRKVTLMTRVPALIGCRIWSGGGGAAMRYACWPAGGGGAGG
jgi:hypothetical protein